MDGREFLDKLFRRDKVGRDPQPATANTDAGIGADTPIRRASQDLLRRNDFAGRIATILSATSLDEGRIFAIRGGWGFGKSSLKHLVIEQLKARDDKVPHLDFNPWQWGDGDAIARALFGEIANSLRTVHSKDAARRAKKFRIYGAILTGSAKPLAKAAGNKQLLASFLTSGSVVALASAAKFSIPEVTTLAIVVAGVVFVISGIGGLLAYLGRDRTSDPLDEIRTSLEAQLRQLPQPLVIFVDDIDRLEPEQIRLLLRHIKANANLPNLIFVLIFQPSIVEAALDPIAGKNGAAFLEKIVQANFDLPAVPISAVHRIFEEQLNELAGRYATEENGFNQVRWRNCLIKFIFPYLNNLRDVRRLLSSMATHLPLHIEGDIFAVNILDFLVLETMRVFEPRLHSQLFRERSLLLQLHRSGDNAGREMERQHIAKLLTTVDEIRNDIAKHVLTELFPRLSWLFGGPDYGPEWYRRWAPEKRVCSERYFPLYFQLQVPEGELSESDFVVFLAASSDVSQMDSVLVDIETRKLFPSLARRLDDSVEQLPVANAAVLLAVMFKLGEKLRETHSVDPFNLTWTSTWRAAHWFLKRIPPEDRSDLAVAALRESGGLAVAMILIRVNDPENPRSDRHNPALDGDAVQTMKQEFLRQVRLLTNDQDQMLSRPDLMELLYRWRDYTGSIDAPRQWVDGSMVSDARFASFVTRMMSRGITTHSGDQVGSPHYTFHKETVEDFIGIEAAQERLDRIDTDGLPADQTHALDVLRKHLEEWRQADARGSA
ncbi:P-loop NTPase fold protein (plasmid) [Tistrella mobilis]|uniref:KAP family P-loop NTPase fold protein n=1 Tax=Tistrella mobilis TaxID=171437 RepID=UPI0035578DAD